MEGEGFQPALLEGRAFPESQKGDRGAAVLSSVCPSLKLRGKGDPAKA